MPATTGQELQFKPLKFMKLCVNVERIMYLGIIESLNYVGNDRTCIDRNEPLAGNQDRNEVFTV